MIPRLRDGVPRLVDMASRNRHDIPRLADGVSRLRQKVYRQSDVCSRLRHVASPWITAVLWLANTGLSWRSFPAPLLAQIYGQHGQRLLERNVRAFLQAKGKVNKGLQKTLKEEPHRFLAYNNGQCCTAAEVKVGGGRGGHGLLNLKGAVD